MARPIADAPFDPRSCGWLRLSAFHLADGIQPHSDCGSPSKGPSVLRGTHSGQPEPGRPDRIQRIFPRKIIRTTPGSFRTRVLREGVHPSLHISYKHFDLKQYFKEGRGLRTEGTFHDPGDFEINKGIENMPYLKNLGRQINRRLLEVERVSQNCGLSAESIQ